MLISHQQIFLVFLIGILVGFFFACIFLPFNDFATSSSKCQCRQFDGVQIIQPSLAKVEMEAEKMTLKTTTQAFPMEGGIPSNDGKNIAGGDWHDPKEKAASELQRILGLKNETGPSEIGQMFFHNASSGNAHNETNTLAAVIGQRVRIFCWIMTGADNHDTKAVHIKATWAKRCNKFVFISTKESADLPAISLNISDGRDHLWGKTKAAFKFAYEKHLNDFDWFLKVDDDTFVIVENLRFMLMAYSPEEPIHHGCKFSPIVKQGYMSGGAGYVLSRAALKLFVEKGIPNPDICRQDENGAEDAEMGKCMERLGIRAGDSRDNEGRHRFFPFAPDHHLPPGKKDPDYWFWRNIYYDMDQGPGCCSDYAVSFHYMNPGWLYVMEYLVYHLRPFGLDIPFEAEMQGNGGNPSQFELLGQMVLDDAKKQAEQMMGRDDVAWRRGEPTLGPQIITKEPTTPTTTTMGPTTTKGGGMTKNATIVKTSTWP